MSHTVPGRQVARVSLRDDETLVMLVCRAEFIPADPFAEDAAESSCASAFGDMGWEAPEMLDAHGCV